MTCCIASFEKLYKKGSLAFRILNGEKLSKLCIESVTMKVIFCLFALVAIAHGQSTDCMRPCPRIFRPVCGYDGTTKQLYTNECLMNIASCTENKNITIVDYHECLSNSDSESLFGSTSKKTNEFVSQFQNSRFIRANTAGMKLIPKDESEKDMKINNDMNRLQNLWRYGRMDGLEKKQIQMEREPASYDYRVEGIRACFKPCPLIYAPICGSDGTTKRDFPNECMMENTGCAGKKNFTKVNDGDCYSGSNSERFLDLSPKRMSMDQFQNSGVFPVKTIENRLDSLVCPTICPLVYAPVCGSDGTTNRVFPNECVLNITICIEKKIIVKVSSEDCSDESHSQSFLGSTSKGISASQLQNSKVFGEKTAIHNIAANYFVQGDPCVKPCPLIYAPVCGSDGNTYSNECEMEITSCVEKKNITKVKYGDCGSESNSQSFLGSTPKGSRVSLENTAASKAVYYDNGQECPTFCPRIYQPVCGFDGTTNRTYSNECTMKVTSCEEKKNITKVSDGVCKSESNPEFLLGSTPKKINLDQYNSRVSQEKTAEMRNTEGDNFEKELKVIYSRASSEVWNPTPVRLEEIQIRGGNHQIKLEQIEEKIVASRIMESSGKFQSVKGTEESKVIHDQVNKGIIW